MMKKIQTPGDSDTTCTCSYSQERRNSATSCRSNPHRDTHCPSSEKVGHTAETCWSHFARRNLTRARSQDIAGAGSAYGAEAGVSVKDNSVQATRNLKQVTAVTESTKRELVVATRRNAKEVALPKQSKNLEYVSIPRVLNPTLAAPRGDRKSVV